LLIHYSLMLLRQRTVSSWLVRSSPDRAVQVWALPSPGLIPVLCSWAKHSIVTVPLCTQVPKYVPANLLMEAILHWTSIPSRGEVEIFLVFSRYRNWDKVWPNGHLAPMQTSHSWQRINPVQTFPLWITVTARTLTMCPLTESVSRFDGNFDHNIPYSQPITRGAIS